MPAAMTTETTATDTRELIIEAAFACFRRHGLGKTTIVDIARTADVSRSTVYEYFRDKAAIVEACAEGASQKFYREMATAMRKGRRSRNSWFSQGFSSPMPGGSSSQRTTSTSTR